MNSRGGGTDGDPRRQRRRPEFGELFREAALASLSHTSWPPLGGKVDADAAVQISGGVIPPDK